MTIRPPTPPGWSDTDWLKHLEEVTPAKRHHYDMTEAIEIIAKLRAERDALAAELDDHCQQLRKEQLAVQSLHEKLAELAAQEPVGWFRKDHLAHAQRGAFFVGAHKEKDFDDLVPLYEAPGAKQ